MSMIEIRRLRSKLNSLEAKVKANATPGAVVARKVKVKVNAASVSKEQAAFQLLDALGTFIDDPAVPAFIRNMELDGDLIPRSEGVGLFDDDDDFSNLLIAALKLAQRKETVVLPGTTGGVDDVPMYVLTRVAYEKYKAKSKS